MKGPSITKAQLVFDSDSLILAMKEDFWRYAPHLDSVWNFTGTDSPKG